MIATRSPIVQSAVRVATPLAVITAAYLFFAGHNQPGGGFAAGLVLGAVATLRVIAGIGRPRSAHRWLTGGALVVTAVALAPMFGGDVLLDQTVVEVDVPVLGTIKSGSALLFDAGVTAIVVGLVVAVLDAFGAAGLDAAPTDKGGAR